MEIIVVRDTVWWWASGPDVLGQHLGVDSTNEEEMKEGLEQEQVSLLLRAHIIFIHLY